MIILDTNVLSAMMRLAPDAAVIQWLDTQPRSSIWTTAITVFEIEFGIAILPDSRRRSELRKSFDRTIAEEINTRVLPFDASAAGEAASLRAIRQQRGVSGELRDTMIAGITIARRAALATRNTRHFADLPVSVLNPWQD